MANPEGELPARSRMSEVSCRGCRMWFTADNWACPDCGWERPGYNPHIRVEKLNRHTFDSAEYARKNH